MKIWKSINTVGGLVAFLCICGVGAGAASTIPDQPVVIKAEMMPPHAFDDIEESPVLVSLTPATDQVWEMENGDLWYFTANVTVSLWYSPSGWHRMSGDGDFLKTRRVNGAPDGMSGAVIGAANG